MSEPLNVYLKWLGIPLAQQPPDAYRLLGIERFESDTEVIAHAADRQMSHVRTFQGGEHVAQAQQLLNEIAGARVRLLNPQKKAEYDARLRAEFAAAQASHGATPSLAPPPPPPTAAPAGAGSDAEEIENDEPAWRHPAVLAGVTVCLVLITAIGAALAWRAGGQAADQTPVAVAPPETIADDNGTADGEMNADAAPESDAVDPAQSSPAETLPAAKTDSQPLVNEDNAEPVATVSAASKSDPTGSASAQPDTADAPTGDDPIDAARPNKTVPAAASPSKPKAAVPAGDRANASSAPASEPSEIDSALAAATVTPLSSEFTADDPGPPEPDEDAVVIRPKVKLPVPPEELRAATLAEVKQIFASEYEQAKSLEQKRELARVLMRQARDVGDDMNSRFVLLNEALHQAEAGGDFALANRAIDQLDEDFIVEAVELKMAMLLTFSRSAKNNAARHIIATAALDLARRAAQERKFDTAEKLATQAQSLAQRVGDNTLRLTSRNVGNEIKKQRASWAAITAALSKLERDPSDGAAHRIVGDHLCLVEKDWEAGLAHLAKSDHPQLQKLAQQDLAAPESVDEQVALGDAWRELALSDDDLSGYRDREHYWYLKALPESFGLTRTKLEKRLRENPLVPFQPQWLRQLPRSSN